MVSANTTYYVGQAVRLYGGPVITHTANNTFLYNYNPAVVPHYKSNNDTSLIVRVQDAPADGGRWSVKPSKLAFTTSTDGQHFTPITNASVIFDAVSAGDIYATEDPRVSCMPSKFTGLCDYFYLLYSAVTIVNGTWIVRLSMATSPTPKLAGSWVNHGRLFQDDAKGYQWTKSGAMLIRDSPPHYLFYGDSSYVAGLQYATSNDLLTWTTQPGIWLPVRENSFDSKLVEGSAHPILLPTGDYFMLYNSARQDGPTPKEGYTLQYNVGWVILNGSNPVEILQRSSEPILTPVLEWETGMGSNSYAQENRSLTPRVVFCEGWKLLAWTNTSITVELYYGASDSAIGVATVVVSTVPPAVPKKKKTMVLIAVIVIVVATVGAFIVFAVLFRKRRSASSKGDNYENLNN
jgi:predicted GH43/DUF377 family glycosyl hydrolase